MNSQAANVGFILLIAVGAVEVFLSSQWYEGYVRSGLIIFRQRIPLVGAHWNLSIPSLEDVFDTYLVPGILFHRIGAEEFAFREKIITLSLFSYTPLMHGLASLNHAERCVLVEGRLNWFVFTMCVLVVASVPFWEFVPFFAALLVLLYAIQAYRYRHICQVIASQQHR
jgi:hypothetical protein